MAAGNRGSQQRIDRRVEGVDFFDTQQANFDPDRPRVYSEVNGLFMRRKWRPNERIPRIQPREAKQSHPVDP